MPSRPLDPITQEIIHGKLLAAVDEMGIVLARTSMSPVIYEVLDFACGICDLNCDLIAQTNGITLFTGTFSAQVQYIHEKFAGHVRPGDVFVTNDPFRGGTHSCDFALIRPLFGADEHIGYAIAVAHWLDVGGSVPGSLQADAVSVFQEGLRMPGVRLARDDRLLDDIVAIIEENVRLPELARGDLNAQLAAVRIADGRVQEICAKYGRETLLATFSAVLESSERIARAAVAALPDGTYHASDFIDGDGKTADRIPIELLVTVDGDVIAFDFTGSAPARQGPINCSRGALQAAVKTVFKALVAPHAPSNEGWFRPLSVVVPDGTVFSATKPSPTGWYYEGSAQASELAWKALAPLAPDRFCAGTYMSLCATYLCGETADGGLFVHIEPQHGGWGATAERDGASGLIAITDGDTFNYSVELLEAKFPLRVVRYEFNTADGVGAGRHRGGFGLLREYEILSDETYLYGSYGRTATPPWGFDGGATGSVNYMQVVPREGNATQLTRTAYHALREGDRVRLVTGGGGGWGAPRERLREEVERDVADGLLSRARAESDYGVRIAP